MDIFGIGPTELIFIILIALIILGPKDMEKTGRAIGRFLRNMTTSDGWRVFRETSREIRNIPNRLMREANIEDLEKEVGKIGKEVDEIGKEIGPGQIIGEVGLIAPDNKRTMTFEAIEDGVLLTITYSQVEQLYFQNPQFGFYLLRLIGERLLENMDKLAIAKPA